MPSNSLPAVCDVSVTNVCNAACDFCGFSRDKNRIGPRRYLDPEEFARALPILRRRHIRYLTFQGGEPLLHPGIVSLVTSATCVGMQCGLITNGWFLSRDIERLAQAGLRRLLVSIDSANLAEHEANRGLDGLGARIRDGIARARAMGMHGATAAADAVHALGKGDWRTAASSLFQRSVGYSLWALSAEALPRQALRNRAKWFGVSRPRSRTPSSS